MSPSTIRTALALCCAAAAVAAPAALATRGEAPQKPEHPAQPSAPAKVAKVAYVVTGAVTNVATDSFTMSVKRANRHARVALAGKTSITVKVGPATKITRAGHGTGAATLADLKAGAKVVVTWAAPRKSDVETLVARRVSFKLPVVTPAP